MATKIRLQRHGRKSYAFYSIVSNRLTQIVQGITNTHPIRIKATIEVFLEEFDPRWLFS